jgi:hypothetical protein
LRATEEAPRSHRYEHFSISISQSNLCRQTTEKVIAVVRQACPGPAEGLTMNVDFLLIQMLLLTVLSEPRGSRKVSQRPAGAYSRIVRLAVLSLFILCLASLPRPANAVLVDHIVAAVNRDVITYSDLEHAVALNMRLGAGGKDRKLLESETLEGLITRRLLVQEARRLRFVDVTDQEISAESDKLRKQFVEKKVGLFMRVSREQAQKFFEERSDLYKGRRFQDVQKLIYSLLTKQKIDQQLDQYVTELRSKADIRITAR